MSPQDNRAKGNMDEPDKSETDGNPSANGDKGTHVKPDLFKGVQFCICDDVDAAEEVKKILVEGGGKLVNYLSDIATHLIASNPDHQDVCQAVEIYEKPVVTSRWVWLSAKAGCLLPTAAFSPLKNRLMSDIVACPSNLTREDLDAVWSMITYHGGSFQIDLNSKCTHLISSKAEGSKYEKALPINEKIKIVTPDWVVDSIKGKRLCDEELYHPKLIISPDFKSELETETSIIPVSMPESVTITPATSMEQNNVSTGAPSTQVTLRTVSLPTSTMITSFTAPPGPMQQSRPLRVLVPSQNQEMTPVAPQQSGQPRQVYLALQQPQVRQQQVNFVQVRQHIPRGQGNEGVQMPVKPIILQQRIQPPALQQVQPQPQPQQQQQPQPQPPQQQQQQQPQLQLHQQQNQQLIHQIPQSQQQIHQQQAQVQHLQHPQQQQLQLQQQQQQYQQHIQQHYPPLKDSQPGIVHSSFVQNQQQPLHPQQQQGQGQQQQQIQQLQHPHPQIPHQMQQQQQQPQQQQQQQFTQIQQQPLMKQQQYIQTQQYHLPNQQPIQNQAQQQPNQITFKMGAPPNYPGSTGIVSPGVQYVNTVNQNQTVQDSNQQIRFVQGQQLIQVQRQVAPMQQQRPPHMQLQPGQQMMRGPIQQTQVFTSPPNNHDGVMQDIQQQNSVRIVQNQQFIEIQRHNAPPQMVNISQHNGPHLIRTGSPQQIVYQHQGPPHQRPVMQGTQQVMQPGAPIYNQQGQQVAIGPSQVQRVPQLRMQPNFQQIPRNQFRGQVQTQQIIAGGPRTLIRQGVPVQGQTIPRQGPPPGSHTYFQQPPHMVGVQQQPQQAAPTPQLLDQQHGIQNQIPAQQHSPHPQHPGVQLESHSVQKPNQTLIRQTAPGWSGQQWATPPDSPMIQNQQRPLIRSPSNNLLIAQPNGPGTPQILHTPQHDGARKQLPFGNQTPVRIMHPVGQRFPVANQASEQLKQTAALASSLSNILPNGEIIPSGPSPIEQLAERLFGHEPRILVPPSFCLAGCVFYFLDAEKNICSVSDERLESCKKIVHKYGGEMEKIYTDKCTHVVCETQQNPVVQQALKEGKRCVTLFWLNDIILEGKMKPPFKIWHLPRAFDGDFLPCRDHIITLTNFEGNERVFVKELIKVTGAQYTNYLNHKNTILICKKLEGSKFRKALQWDMPVVNLTWLQDILFGHHNQALSALHKSQRYTKFESKDCCEIDYNLVKPLLAAWKVPLKVPEDLPRRIMALKEEDIKKKPPPPPVQPSPVQTSTSVQSPLPQPQPQPSTAPSTTQSPQAPVTLQQQQPPPTPPQQPPPALPPLPSSLTTVESMEVDQIPDTPKPVPTLIAKKPENAIPSLASLEISDNKDCLSNEPTMKKVKLEPSNEGSTNENLTGNLPPPPPLMVAPFANASPDRAAVKVMFTGYNDVVLLNELKEYAKKLGLTLTNEYNKCTHLIVNRIARTSKFMCAFNYADHILTSDWIVDSFKRSHLLDESQYILSDPKGEHLYGFDLKESLARRKARKTPLFKDHVFYITRSCLPSFKILKEIAESAGAVVTKKGPSPKQLHALKKRRNDIIFAVITKEEDLHTCDLFFEKETHVLNSEFILHSLLRQEIEYEPYTFKSP